MKVKRPLWEPRNNCLPLPEALVLIYNFFYQNNVCNTGVIGVCISANQGHEFQDLELNFFILNKKVSNGSCTLQAVITQGSGVVWNWNNFKLYKTGPNKSFKKTKLCKDKPRGNNMVDLFRLAFTAQCLQQIVPSCHLLTLSLTLSSCSHKTTCFDVPYVSRVA